MSVIKGKFKVTGGSLTEIAARVITSVFELSTTLEEREALMIGAQLDEVRKVIQKALTGYPQSQIELVIKCLLAESEMDTEEEANKAMVEADDDESEE